MNQNYLIVVFIIAFLGITSLTLADSGMRAPKKPANNLSGVKNNNMSSGKMYGPDGKSMSDFPGGNNNSKPSKEKQKKKKKSKKDMGENIPTTWGQVEMQTRQNTAPVQPVPTNNKGWESF